MAIGDDAIGENIAVVDGNETGSAKNIDDYINRLADELARRTKAAWLSGRLGLTASATAPLERWLKNGNFGTDDLSIRFELGRAVFKVNASDQGQIAYLTDIPAATPPQDISGKVNRSGDTMSGGLQVNGTLSVPNSSAATSSYTVAYINGDGRVSRGASSQRYKKYIKPIDPAELGDIFPVLQRFKMRSDGVAVADEKWRIGYIAEELAQQPDQERFVVWRDVDGNGEPVPDSIDFIELLLAQVAQLNRRLGLMADRIDTLERGQA